LLLTEGLSSIDAGVLGRILIYFGEVVTTISILMVAKEANKSAQLEIIKENKIMKVSAENTTNADVDNIRNIISELQLQNKYLQEQIWALQEDLSNIQNRN